MPRFGSWHGYARVCGSMRGYTRVYVRVRGSRREYARVYASVREYVWVYARVCVGMASMHGHARVHTRECMRGYAPACMGIRAYMRENVREYAWACASMRQYAWVYASICASIMRMHARVFAPAHFQTRCVNHVVCQARLLGGNSKCYDFLSALNMRKRLCGLLKYPAVTWGKAILL